MKNKLIDVVIGICDDDDYVHAEIDELLNNYSKGKNISIITKHYLSAGKLLENSDNLDVLILDIDMPGIDGIEAGHILRKRKVDYKIIMLTGRPDRVAEAFEIEAYRFVVKPISIESMIKALDDSIYFRTTMREVSVYRDRVKFGIPQRSILYVEANQSGSLIFTTDSEYRSEKSLSEWDGILDNRVFFRCHKSYVVNMGEISQIFDKEIRMVNGDRVPLSRRIKKEFFLSYAQYDTKWR